MDHSLRVVVLGVDDMFVHVYPDAAHMLTANDIGFGPGAEPFPLELFTEDGRRLAGVYDDTWRVSALVPCGPADPDGLRQRLVNAIGNLRRSFEDSPERLALYGLAPEHAIEGLEEVAGEQSSLEEMLGLFAFDHDPLVVGMGGELDNRGFLHNWWRH